MCNGFYAIKCFHLSNIVSCSCLFVLILYIPVFQSCRDEFLCSWVEPVLSKAGPHSAVGNMSGYRCVSDCRSRGREFDPGPVPYFRGD